MLSRAFLALFGPFHGAIAVPLSRVVVVIVVVVVVVVVVDIDAQAAYKNYCIDHNQILQSDRDPQILTVGGPNMHQTNPRWRTAAILKNRKILISSQPVDRL